ncbi:hypothetical protein HNQ59_002841 [Chitinivorax tropicus]|uniref:Uncharacterized protein n=1 Tax=Chitinivorax tropicus TaxID=714531 RepID=A0A840MR30_9PROT|nr:hypothetical protein [Chitinivorax tropicus]MBB5019539.1 hypothetical protein [Chitinivorax tropicus]
MAAEVGQADWMGRQSGVLNVFSFVWSRPLNSIIRYTALVPDLSSLWWRSALLVDRRLGSLDQQGGWQVLNAMRDDMGCSTYDVAYPVHILKRVSYNPVPNPFLPEPV